MYYRIIEILIEYDCLVTGKSKQKQIENYKSAFYN